MLMLDKGPISRKMIFKSVSYEFMQKYSHSNNFRFCDDEVHTLTNLGRLGCDVWDK